MDDIPRKGITGLPFELQRVVGQFHDRGVLSSIDRTWDLFSSGSSSQSAIEPALHCALDILYELTCAPTSLTQLLTNALEGKGETTGLGRGQVNLPHWRRGRTDAREVRRKGSREGCTDLDVRQVVIALCGANDMWVVPKGAWEVL